MVCFTSHQVSHFALPYRAKWKSCHPALTRVLHELAKKSTTNHNKSYWCKTFICAHRGPGRCIFNFQLIVSLPFCRNIDDAGAKLDQKNEHTRVRWSRTAHSQNRECTILTDIWEEDLHFEWKRIPLNAASFCWESPEIESGRRLDNTFRTAQQASSSHQWRCRYMRCVHQPGFPSVRSRR